MGKNKTEKASEITELKKLQVISQTKSNDKYEAR
jgi:hypothetical protein